MNFESKNELNDDIEEVGGMFEFENWKEIFKDSNRKKQGLGFI